MLDDGVPDLELGTMTLAMRMKTESVSALMGFYNAVSARLHRLEAPAGKLRPVVIPSYNSARKQPNLMPLIALELERFGVPVLMHGALDGGRITFVPTAARIKAGRCPGASYLDGEWPARCTTG